MSKVSTGVMTPAISTERGGISARWRKLSLLAQMGIVALAVHLVVFTIFSVGGYLPHEKTPDELYEKGAAAMSCGKYAEARDLFQKVLDQQPKPLPVFARAAEQHRNAERLATQAETAGDVAAIPAPNVPAPVAPVETKVIEKPSPAVAAPAAKPLTPVKSAKPPASPDQIIPPELR